MHQNLIRDVMLPTFRVLRNRGALSYARHRIWTADFVDGEEGLTPAAPPEAIET